MAKFALNLTAQGSALLGKVLKSKTLTFTAMAFGDGVYSGSAMQKESLTAEQLRTPISEIIVSGNQAVVRSTVTYADLPAEFKWRELGIYAKNPDGGSDVLYAYANAGEDYDTIGGTGALREMIVRVRIAVTDASDVTINVNSGSTVYVSQSEFDKLKDAIKQATGIDPDNPSAPVSLGIPELIHDEPTNGNHTLTGLGDQTGLVPIKFIAKHSYHENDKISVDGIPYATKMYNGLIAGEYAFKSNATILAVLNTDAKEIYFPPAGWLDCKYVPMLSGDSQAGNANSAVKSGNYLALYNVPDNWSNHYLIALVYSGGDQAQIAIRQKDGQISTRYKQGGTWHSWKKLATKEYVDSKIQYSQTDLQAGVSPLATGTLYVVYE